MVGEFKQMLYLNFILRQPAALKFDEFLTKEFSFYIKKRETFQ